MPFEPFLLLGLVPVVDSSVLGGTILTVTGLNVANDVGVDHHLEDMILIVKLLVANMIRQAVDAEVKVVALQRFASWLADRLDTQVSSV
jgi:hypothetical protein